MAISNADTTVKNLEDSGFIELLKDANLAYNVAVERNLNVYRMKQQLQNVLWTYHNEITAAMGMIVKYRKQVEDLNGMIDALSAINAGSVPDAATDEAPDAPAAKKKAR